MLKTTYLDLLGQLTSKVPELLFIDLDRGQYENPEANYIPQFPSCLVNFDQVPWADIGDYVLHGDARITLRIAFQIYNDINNISPEEIRTAGLAELDVLEKVNLAMHGFAGTSFSKMQHVNTSQKNNGLAVVFDETYSCVITNTSARDKHYTEDTVQLTVEISKQ